MPKSKKSILKKVLPETGILISRVIYIVATNTARWTIIGISVLLTGYLVYGWIWQPLQSRDVLPPGVNLNSTNDPNALQSINNQRAERSQHIPYDFTQEAQIIAPNRGAANPTTNAPTTL